MLVENNQQQLIKLETDKDASNRVKKKLIKTL
jgi:hypothetical protein